MASIVNCSLQGFVFVATLGLSLAHPQFWDGCTHPDRDYLGGHKQVLPSRCAAARDYQYFAPK
jgi:hypothetical protein